MTICSITPSYNPGLYAQQTRQYILLTVHGINTKMKTFDKITLINTEISERYCTYRANHDITSGIVILIPLRQCVSQ